MRFSSFDELIAKDKALISKGPLALIFVEDEVEIDTTLRHHVDLGFKQVIAFMPAAFKMAYDVSEDVIRVDCESTNGDDMIRMVNRVAKEVPGQWLYYCFNAEYLLFPFCETRTVGEMLAFHTEERRSAMLSYVIDLYADNLWENPNAVSIEKAMMDKTGYYALSRNDPDNHNHPKDRQLNFYGGLRWRYEEHIPQVRRKIDRVSIFRATEDVELRSDFTMSDEEMNTFSCEWHNNITASVCSFRTAKALKTNAGSTFDINTFKWHNSVPFEWHSRQLLDLGLMEPGQWF
ncbi:hypothetical protein [Cognatishimia activa]|uniref:Uncharacterized protein n=1 Tax=Cognatishimia activa TaxID=1715691 RepID=A0A0P1J080_9RHOB|nr:hypothetical protein [Cognatishimia activa]CUI70351.1 hypothetical protein TA5113_01206 [Cognatishimia activa]CUK26564.1 hypothetical protein TA5114_02379 [Cognatishimia activa]